MPAPITGGCLCGAVRYSCSAEPIMGGHCQCRTCQRFTGAGHTSMVLVPEDALSLTGTLKFYQCKADSGATVSRGFCPDCGAPVMGRTTGMPGHVILVVASFDDPSVFVPQIVVFSASAQKWDTVDPALPAFPGMPPMEPRQGAT